MKPPLCLQQTQAAATVKPLLCLQQTQAAATVKPPLCPQQQMPITAETGQKPAAAAVVKLILYLGEEKVGERKVLNTGTGAKVTIINDS